ncbi:unnamed protein product [Chondrus crispus]|uniref:Uncharacterized protein n=1 Tax=Chondrus crispus TaxID=2769 RepID=R7QVI0_CHOCR|nr:unnamed protein product [Chondrus crispus]CDF41340.1 unnamed protein product [Chondrus crispus]|eukprot:XP_005711634.1 unnamed protein product [Chondrus crispus]
MASSAFVTALPATFRSTRRRVADGPTARHNRSTVRATAHQPPSSGEGLPDNESLKHSRAALEKMLGLELKVQDEKKGQCACIWCSGTKKRKCSWCDGKGCRQEMAQKSWEELSTDIEKMTQGDNQFMELPEKILVQCSACSGTKQLRCGYCRGSGIGSYGHAH